MEILVTNDDGVLAEGLAHLRRALEPLGKVWVVAPEREQSGTSHALTLHRPLRVRRIEERVFGVDGTPTDCVLLACRGIHEFGGAKIDLVASGINHGANLSGDLAYSGTVAAAIEGRMFSLPSVAISSEGGSPDGLDASGQVARFIVEKLIEHGLPDGVLLNVNVPKDAIPGAIGYRITTLGSRACTAQVIRKTDPRGRPYYWIGEGKSDARPVAGCDEEALAQGLVSVTPLRLNLTDHPSVGVLASWNLPEGVGPGR